MVSRTACSIGQKSGSERQKSILVIENHLVIQELLNYCLALSRYGCSIVDARHIPSLTWIENIASPLPDAIILDVDICSLDFKSPLDFIYAFCTRWQRVFLSTQMPPLILLTVQPVISEKLQREGYTVVMKPFKLPVLLSRVEAATEQK